MGAGNGKPVLRDEDISILTQSSGLTETQVKETFQAFVSSNPDGKFDKKEFRVMMKKALPKKDALKMEKHIFRMYDTDQSGTIDFTEFMILYHIMNDGSPEEVLEKIFRVFDVNSDGVITGNEMSTIVKDMHELIKSQNPNLSSHKDLSASVFQEMDKNEDGQITREEFISACLGQKEISKMLAIKIIDIFIEDE